LPIEAERKHSTPRLLRNSRVTTICYYRLSATGGVAERVGEVLNVQICQIESGADRN